MGLLYLYLLYDLIETKALYTSTSGVNRTHRQLRSGYSSNVLEVCVFYLAYSRVRASLFFSVTARTVNIRLSCTDTQDFLPVSRLKLKRGSLQMPDGAGPSFASPNQSAVLSCSQCDTEENDVSSQPSSRKVQNSICRHIQSPYQPLRYSHKSKQKLSTLVDMKSSHPSSYCIRNPSQAITCFWLKFRMPG